MKLKSISDLIIINSISIMFILIAAFLSSSILRMILSVPVILFFPGYTTLAFFFPKPNTLSTVERVVLSVALSITVTTFIGFGLSFTPWGIDVYPVIFSVTVFIIITSVMAWYRRRKITK